MMLLIVSLSALINREQYILPPPTIIIKASKKTFALFLRKEVKPEFFFHNNTAIEPEIQQKNKSLFIESSGLRYRKTTPISKERSESVYLLNTNMLWSKYMRQR